MNIQQLSESNQWWATKSVDELLTGSLREEYELILKSTKVREIIIITGVRRSGKSTLMYQLVDKLLKEGASPEQILFVNLEDAKLAKDSLEDIYQTYRQGINPDKKAYIFLDEIHRKEKWESWIRGHYDLHSDCKFIISGSCSYLLKKEYSTLLTGRNLTFEIFPLSFKEHLIFKGITYDKRDLLRGILSEKNQHILIKELGEYLLMGGFPTVFFQEKEFKSRLLAQYFDDIIYKDIIDRYNLNSQKARDLALFLITNFTSTISLRNIRNALGLSYDTVKDYIAYFKEAYLFFTMDHFSYSMKEQKTTPQKIYCIDNGLRNAVSFKFSKDEGKLAENLTFLELKRRNKDIYYWKSPSQEEVDFIIKEKDQSLTAINVSYGDSIDEREIKGLISFKKKFKKAKKFLVLTKNIEKQDKSISYVPLWKWLLQE